MHLSRQMKEENERSQSDKPDKAISVEKGEGSVRGEERAQHGCDLNGEKDGRRWRVRERDAEEGGAKCSSKANSFIFSFRP